MRTKHLDDESMCNESENKMLKRNIFEIKNNQKGQVRKKFRFCEQHSSDNDDKLDSKSQ